MVVSLATRAVLVKHHSGRHPPRSATHLPMKKRPGWSGRTPRPQPAHQAVPKHPLRWCRRPSLAAARAGRRGRACGGWACERREDGPLETLRVSLWPAEAAMGTWTADGDEQRCAFASRSRRLIPPFVRRARDLNARLPCSCPAQRSASLPEARSPRAPPARPAAPPSRPSAPRLPRRRRRWTSSPSKTAPRQVGPRP